MSPVDDFKTLILRLKCEAPGKVRQIASETRIPYATLRKIREGRTTNPRVNTADKLRAWYMACQ